MTIFYLTASIVLDIFFTFLIVLLLFRYVFKKQRDPRKKIKVVRIILAMYIVSFIFGLILYQPVMQNLETDFRMLPYLLSGLYSIVIFATPFLYIYFREKHELKLSLFYSGLFIVGFLLAKYITGWIMWIIAAILIRLQY